MAIIQERSSYPIKDFYKCECVVVGSGPGGSITAHHLAKSGRETILIESGGHFSQKSSEPYSLKEIVEKYRQSGLTFALGTNKISYGEAQTVGGGSEINAGFYHETPEIILESWKTKFDLKDSSYSEMSPYFDSTKKALSVSKMPIKPAPSSMMMAIGAENMGWSCREIPRWFRYDVEKSKAYGKPIGVRQSMTETYLPEAEDFGLTIYSRTEAHRIRKNRNGWSVLCRHKNRSIEIQTKDLFLAAGNTQTPHLLLRSGINRNIGNNFQLHPMLKIVAEFNEDVNENFYGIPVHQVKHFSPDLSFGCSIASTPFLGVGLNSFGITKFNSKKMAIYYVAIIPSGTGKISNLPFFKNPLVQYRLTDDDKKRLYDGLSKISELLFSAGAKRLYPSIDNFPVIDSMDAFRNNEYTSKHKFNLMTIHQFSSCPMGENTKICATNSFGKVHQTDNLYVCDASLLCSAPSVNPQGSIMAFAERNVLNYLGKL